MNLHDRNIPSVRDAFTLMELLIVTGVIATLAMFVAAAVNPRGHLIDARNAKRRADTSTIRSAVLQYVVDTGSVPDGVTQAEKPVCKPGVPCSGGVSLDVLVDDYIADIPADPLTEKTSTVTDYVISMDASGRVHVKAPNAVEDVVAEHESDAPWVADLLR